MTAGERVKYLRKDVLKLTLERFGERLGVTKQTVSRIENGINNLTDQMILSICREFNINENWLRTGEGEMRPTLTREAEIAEITATLFRDQEQSFRYRLIKALSVMDEDGLKYLEQLAEDIVNNKKKD